MEALFCSRNLGEAHQFDRKQSPVDWKPKGPVKKKKKKKEAFPLRKLKSCLV